MSKGADDGIATSSGGTMVVSDDKGGGSSRGSQETYKFTVTDGVVTGVVRIDAKGREKTRSLSEPNKSYVVNPDGSVSIVETYSGFVETEVYADADRDGIYQRTSKFKTLADGTMLFDDSGDDRGGNVRRVGTEGDDVLIGVARSESIEGGAGDDRIDGRGGRDKLTGGAGNDTFVLSKKAGVNHLASITDFTSLDDQIELDDKVFKGVTAGSVLLGERALDADDRLILKDLNNGSFELYYDRDGSGKKAAFLVATIVGTVTADDISIV